MPLVIPKRQIDLNPNLTVKPKTIGEDHFARLAFGVQGVVLSADEFNALLLDEGAFKRFYKTPKESDPVPRYETFSHLVLNSFARSQVLLYVSRRVMKIKDANIVKNKILLLPGHPVWQFTIQALPDLDQSTLDLLLKLGDKGQIELECESYGAQPQLPLEDDEEGADEDDAQEDGEDEGKSGIQRQIEGNEAKRSRKASS